MNKIYLGIFLMLLTKIASAQYFTLAPEGFLSKEKTDYTVVDVPKANQQELYNNVLKSINSLYTNPQKGLTVVNGQSITLSAYEKKALKVSGSYFYDVDYNLTFLFKNGRIRINAPTFDAGFMDYSGTWKRMNPKKVYFKSNGETRGEKNLQEINNYFNGLIKSIIDMSAKIDNW